MRKPSPSVRARRVRAARRRAAAPGRRRRPRPGTTGRASAGTRPLERLDPPPTGISAAERRRRLRRHQVRLDGTADSSPIYLHGVTIGGRRHDAFFVTTTYGKTIAIDADTGAILWALHAARLRLAGPGRRRSRRRRRSPTRVACRSTPRRRTVASRSSPSPTGTPAGGPRSRRCRRARRSPRRSTLRQGRVIATTGGYIGDAPPYQGHVAILDAATGRLLHVWNSLCSDRTGLLDPRACPVERLGDLGTRRRRRRPGDGNIFVATGNARWNGRTDWGDATLVLDAGRDAPPRQLHAGEHRGTERAPTPTSARPRRCCSATARRAGRQGRQDPPALPGRLKGAAPHRGGELQIVSTPSGDRSLHGAGRVADGEAPSGCSRPTTAARRPGRCATAACSRVVAQRPWRHEPRRGRRAALRVRPRRRPARLPARRPAARSRRSTAAPATGTARSSSTAGSRSRRGTRTTTPPRACSTSGGDAGEHLRFSPTGPIPSARMAVGGVAAARARSRLRR